MVFYDYAKVYVKGGDGGDGCIAFRREKFVPEGGPWGGDGGKGGDVILRGDKGLRTLVDFKYKRHYKAERGQHGQGKNMHGRAGKDLVMGVPVGTVVKDADTGEVIADIVEDGQEVVAARGGRGGRGNTRFASSKNKAPSFAEKGEPGMECTIELELKLLADVALIGYPNAGKSTTISMISAAKPKIDNYPFTTLTPNLGVVKAGETSFVAADIPGLIEGAHTGTGLGHSFLRHTERTRLLIHVIDAASVEGRDPLMDFKTVNNELQLYSSKLAQMPQLIAANKIDIPGAMDTVELLKEELPEYEIFPMSAATGEGLDELVHRAASLLEELSAVPVEEEREEEVVTHRHRPRFVIEKDDEAFIVHGEEVERHIAMTDLENEEAVERLQRIFKKMGLESALRREGAVDGSLIRIGDFEFYFEE